MYAYSLVGRGENENVFMHYVMSLSIDGHLAVKIEAGPAVSWE